MGEIQDGSAVFKIMDEREKEMNRKFVDLAYPVGIVVAIANDKKPAFMEYGTWEKVAEDRVLQGSSDGHVPGTKIEPGLPNITGSLTETAGTKSTGGFYNVRNERNGALGFGENDLGSGPSWSDHSDAFPLIFDASMSNDIYGASDTVQPPAYVVAYWQRTA